MSARLLKHMASPTSVTIKNYRGLKQEANRIHKKLWFQRLITVIARSSETATIIRDKTPNKKYLLHEIHYAVNN
jgi:hypothetical protein